MNRLSNRDAKCHDTDKVYDVIVIGAGPAGLFFARKLKLADRSVSILVIDKKKEVRRKLCGDYLCPPAVSLFERNGLAELTGQSAKILGLRLATPAGRLVQSRFMTDDKQPVHGLSLSRERLDGHLLDQAIKAGVEVRMGTACLGVEQSPGLIDVKAGCGPDSEQRLHCRFLVGADGRNSFVARKLGWNRRGDARRIAMRVFARRLSSDREFGEMHIIDDRSYVGVNPVDAERSSLCFVTDHASVKDRDLKSIIREMIAGSVSLRERYQLPTEFRVETAYPLEQYTHTYASGNAVLLGDAAGFVDPLTGEGNYNAMRSAELLADIMVSDGTGFSDVAAKYQRAYEREFRGKFILHHLFQFLVTRPALCEGLAIFLQTSRGLRRMFIGMVANVRRLQTERL